MLLWWIDAAYAREIGNQWITFFFTTMWLPLCGVLSLLALVCLGLCLEELSTCLLVGGCLKVEECCNLEDGADLPFLVCMEGKK
jgi:hypothetical protein